MILCAFLQKMIYINTSEQRRNDIYGDGTCSL